jgi:hypothetical protein
MNILRAAIPAALIIGITSCCTTVPPRPGFPPAAESGTERPATQERAASGTLVLAKNGRTDYRIVVSDSASHADMYAAIELQDNLHRMTGAEFPIFSDRLPSRGKEIVLGAGDRIRLLVPDLSMKNLGDEGYILRTAGTDLVIAGDGPRGTLYGVYGFLDRLGCRWFTPTVSRIPRIDVLSIPPLDEVKIPLFEYRDTYLWEVTDGDWAAHNGYNRNGRTDTLGTLRGGRIEWVPLMFAHTFQKLVPPDVYYASHPEYFSLVGGKRLKDQSQLCCTNEDVIRIATEAVLKAFKENPAANVISVSQNDWYNYCECPKCKELAEREGTQMAPVLYLVNRIAETVEKQYPGHVVDTLAYQWSRGAPKTMRPRPNVAIRLCTIECCFSHSLQACTSPENALFVRDLEAWSKAADRLWIWNYCTSYAHYFIPFPDLWSRADNIRFFKENGVTGVFQQDVYTTPNGELSDLSGYLNARLIEDPSRDTDTVIREFTDGVYGPAAAPIRAYLDMLHAAVKPDTVHIGIWQGPDAAYLTDDILARADSLWNAAEAAAKDSAEVLDRVRIARLPADYALICRDRLRGGALLVDQEKLRLVVNPAFTARVDRFCGIADRAGVLRLREFDTTVQQFRDDIAKTVHDSVLVIHPPDARTKTAEGLAYRCYEGTWKRLPDFSAMKPARTGTVDHLTIPSPVEGPTYGFVFDGWIDVPADGVYTFSACSDGYSALTVSGDEIIKNGGTDPIRERCGYIALKAGLHPVKLVYFTLEGCTNLTVSWSGPGFDKREIPTPSFCFAPSGGNGGR